MSLFGKLTNEGLEESKDHLGGFSVRESNIYAGVIKAMYAGESSKGAMSITGIFDIDGQEYRETFWVTNRNGENFWVKDGKTKVPLPGFTVVDDICLIATGKPLADQDHEEKVLNIYDFEEKKEVPKSVPVLVDLIGQEISLGILKQLENKNVQNSSGEYEPTADTRELNVVDKVFHPEMKLTVAEARNGQEEAKFWDSWLKRNEGRVNDRRKIKDGEGGSSGAPPKASSAGASKPATKSLFGKK